MLFRCFIVLIITTNQVFTQSDDEITAQWLIKKSKNITKQNTEDDFNLDQSVDPQSLNKIVEEREQIKNERNKDNEDSFNLDPNLEASNIPTTAAPIGTPQKVLNDLMKITDEILLNPSLSEKPQECFTNYDNQRGSCVLYFQCDPDYRTVIDDGSTLIDLRERACSHYLEVCCLTSKITAAGNKPLVENLPEIHGTDKMDSSRCGWNNPALHIFQKTSKEIEDNRIYANYGDFPWMIALIKKRNTTEEWSRNDYLGGGSLIHPAVVLTAAHKVDQYAAREIKCRAGEWDTQTTFELFEHQERDVKKIIIHPEFFKTSVYNDIAVLFLKSDFEMTNSPNIGVACVGTVLPPPGTECFSMGWGKEFKQKNKYAVILKKVRLPLVGAQRCEELLRKTRLGPYFKVHKSLTCAGGENGTDTCRGDGGSSLVCPVQTVGESTRYAVFGMVAYGIGCFETDTPSVYVNVPHLKPWLDATLVAEGYTTNMTKEASLHWANVSTKSVEGISIFR